MIKKDRQGGRAVCNAASIAGEFRISMKKTSSFKAVSVLLTLSLLAAAFSLPAHAAATQETAQTPAAATEPEAAPEATEKPLATETPAAQKAAEEDNAQKNAQPSPAPSPTAAPLPSASPTPSPVPTQTSDGEETSEEASEEELDQYDASAGVESFVTRLYEVCLQRSPDADGLAYWENRLSNGASGASVAYGFVFSKEFKSQNYCNTDYAKMLYRAFMGREFDQDGLNDWVGRLNRGAKREEVFNGFALSIEFGRLCSSYGIERGSAIAVPAYGTVPTGACSVCGEESLTVQFVTRMYHEALNREPDAAGLADWCSRLQNHTASGRDLVKAFFLSDEFVAHHYSNKEFLLRLYRAMLGREADAYGLEGWLGYMARGPLRSKIIWRFGNSQEFINLCAAYGIERGSDSLYDPLLFL